MNPNLTIVEAAEVLDCSKAFLVKEMKKGEIPFTKVGGQHRIKTEDVLAYKKKKKQEQKKHLIDMMEKDEELGLYDS